MNTTNDARLETRDNLGDNPAAEEKSERADARTVEDAPEIENAPERKETALARSESDKADDDPLVSISHRLDEIDSLVRRLSKASEMSVAELLDARDSASFLGLARSTFLSRNSTGEIAPVPVRIGGRVSWRRSELIAWLDAGCPARAVWMARKELSKK